MKKVILLSIIAIAFLAVTSPGEYIINGIITDELGEPLFGATVILKGTKTETKTDLDGKFSFKSSDYCAVIFIIYPGFTRMEAEVCAGKENKFVFEEGGTLESFASRPRMISGDDIINLPTGQFIYFWGCGVKGISIADINRKSILKIEESQPDVTVYLIDGIQVTKEEILLIPEMNILDVSILESVGTPSIIDTYKEKDLLNTIDLIRTKVQLKQK